MIRSEVSAAEVKLVSTVSFAVAVAQVVIIDRFWGRAVLASLLAVFLESGA